MPAIDTIASYQGTSGSTLASGTMASGDSSTIRYAPPTSDIRLLAAMYDDVTTPETWRVRSPLLHDNVRGIQFFPAATAEAELLPPGPLQKFYPQDSLIFEFTTAAATGKALGALSIFYSQLPGVASRLYMPGDVFPLVDAIKPLSVAVGSGANTAGAWYDLVITTTEDLLDANTDYAVLGITFDQAVAAVGVKGADTGNLRVSAPGNTNPQVGAEYFVRLSRLTGLPCIPVINSANKNNTYISVISSAATGAAGTVQLILARLSQVLPTPTA